MNAHITIEFDTFPTEIYQNLTQIIDSLEKDNWQVIEYQREQKCIAKKDLPAIDDLSPPVPNEPLERLCNFFRKNHLKYFNKSRVALLCHSRYISLTMFKFESDGMIGTIEWER